MDETQQTVVTAPQGFGLSVSRDPSLILGEAKKAAKALTDVISALPKEKKVMMGGEQYIEFDHWQLVGRFYGCSTKVISTEYVEIGEAKGFLARSVVLDAEGREISAAEAMCLNDEEKWSVRPKYQWKNGNRELVGTVAVPMNQLRSMAQTRSGAKALRNVFSWVVVLAGYAPTPAEEMTGDEHPADGRPEIKPAQAKTEVTKPDLEYITETVASVSKTVVKTKDGPMDKFFINTASGKKMETWDKDVATKADSIAGTASTATFGYVNDPKWGPKLKTLELSPAEAEA